MPITPKFFYMIRHGQTEANAARLMAGSLDSPLTALGRDQAKAARDIVDNLEKKPEFIIHSHLSRARDTAEIINENLKLPMVEDEDFAEMHAGEWEGAPYEVCDELFHGWVNPPAGETVDQFFNRVKRAKNKALSDDRERPLIVCHGGVFRAMAKLYEIDTWGVRNCDLHSFTPNETEQNFPWDVKRIHFEGELIKQPSDSFHNPENPPAEFLNKMKKR